MRTGIEETLDPKYAHIERERRWLVDVSRRPDLSARPFVLIEDRYITGTRMRLRRMTDSASGERALKLTKKYEADDPLARPIVTAYLTDAEYALLEALSATQLRKRRYKLASGAMVFSVDQFMDGLAPLELAEIEWPDDRGLRDLHPPVWAVREVSDDPRYQGSALSIAPPAEERLWPPS